MRKEQVSSLIEEVYDRGRYMGGIRKFRKCERVGQRVWEGVWRRGQRNQTIETEKRKEEIQSRIIKGVYSQTSIWMKKKKVQEEEEEEEMGRKLEQIEKFLKTRNFKRETIL